MMQSKKRQFDKYLVARARIGDRDALEQLITRYQSKLLGHAYRLLGNAESAKDAVQEGWIDILRGLYKLKDEEAFSVWAFRIITRKCTLHISRLQKNRKILKNMQGEPRTESTVSNDIEQVLDQRILRKALAKLPDEHRAAIGLFYLEEMSVAEVAVALEIPVGTVKTRLMHARKKLRAALEGDDYG